MVHEKFLATSTIYNDIIVEKFVVMLNHLHAILVIDHNKLMVKDGLSNTGTTRGLFPTSI